MSSRAKMSLFSKRQIAQLINSEIEAVLVVADPLDEKEAEGSIVPRAAAE